jgi:hypothetical protein
MATYRMKVCRVVVDTSALLTLKQSLQPKAHAILDKAAFDIEATAKTLAPVDTGALRASIYTSGASRGSSYAQAVAAAKGKIGTTGRRSGRRLEKLDFSSEIHARHPFERIIAPSVAYAIFPELRGQKYIEPGVAMHRANFIKAWSELLA